MKASARGQDLNETALRLRGDEEDRMWSVRRAIETSRQDPKRILLKTNIVPLQDNVVRRLCVDEPKGILRQGARVKICPWKDKYLPKGCKVGHIFIDPQKGGGMKFRTYVFERWPLHCSHRRHNRPASDNHSVCPWKTNPNSMGLNS